VVRDFAEAPSRGWRRNELIVVHPEEPFLAWKFLAVIGVLLIARRYGMA